MCPLISLCFYSLLKNEKLHNLANPAIGWLFENELIRLTIWHISQLVFSEVRSKICSSSNFHSVSHFLVLVCYRPPGSLFGSYENKTMPHVFVARKIILVQNVIYNTSLIFFSSWKVITHETITKFDSFNNTT